MIRLGKMKPWEKGIAIRIGDKEFYLRRQCAYAWATVKPKWELGVRLVGLGSDCSKEAQRAITEL